MTYSGSEKIYINKLAHPVSTFVRSGIMSMYQQVLTNVKIQVNSAFHLAHKLGVWRVCYDCDHELLNI